MLLLFSGGDCGGPGPVGDSDGAPGDADGSPGGGAGVLLPPKA